MHIGSGWPSWRRARFAELTVFALVGILIAAPLIVAMISVTPSRALDILEATYMQLVIALIIATFPLLVALMFGNTPVELIRRRRSSAGAGSDVLADAPVLSWRVHESLVFALIGFLILGRIVWASLRYPNNMVEIFQALYLEVLIGIFVGTFPLLHRLTFGITISERFTRSRSAGLARGESISQRPAGEPRRTKDGLTLENVAKTRGELVLQSYVAESREIAEGLYTRAGIYLILGVLISFSGLFFFYTQTTRPATAAAEQKNANLERSGTTVDTPPSAVSDAAGVLTIRLADLAPRFGILFFIEFVAFFFLRQYRSAMDEFRYFEAVKRYRQETFALVCFVGDGDHSADKSALDARLLFSTGIGVPPLPAEGVAETGRLSKDEVAILEKVVAAVRGKGAG